MFWFVTRHLARRCRFFYGYSISNLLAEFAPAMLRRPNICWRVLAAVGLAVGSSLSGANFIIGAELPAFPGAVGQGAAATGGRGGDVYHVTNLSDYDDDKGEPKIPGSLRHAIRSAQGPRTIVFDVGGAIKLRAPIEIHKSKLTIAGQTAPGGITVWGYPMEISKASDVVVRYMRARTGDFNARRRRLRKSPQGMVRRISMRQRRTVSASVVAIE